MKIAKDSIAGRRFVPGFPGLALSRSGYAETEPVHTIVADREAERDEMRENSGENNRRNFRRRAPGHAPPAGMERRQSDRRQRQVDVLLDTRVTPGRRQRQSVDEEA
jgi:hypothetical protein